MKKKTDKELEGMSYKEKDQYYKARIAYLGKVERWCYIALMVWVIFGIVFYSMGLF